MSPISRHARDTDRPARVPAQPTSPRVIDLRNRGEQPAAKAGGPPPADEGGERPGGPDPDTVPTTHTEPHRHRRPREAHRWPIAIAAGGCILVLLGVVAAATGWPSQDSDKTARPPRSLAPAAVVAEATRWLSDNTVPGTRLLVSPQLRAALTGDLPDRRLVSYPAAGLRAIDLVLVTKDLTPTAYPNAESLAALGRPVASFGSALEVRELTPTGTSLRADAVLRRMAGQRLVANAALTLPPDTVEALQAGAVDGRLLMLLAGLADSHRLSLELPSDVAAPGSDVLRRTATISVVDGTAIADRPTVAEPLLRLVRAQGGALRPVTAAVTAVGDAKVLLVRYPVPSPVGLLALPAVPTLGQSAVSQ